MGLLKLVVNGYKTGVVYFTILRPNMTNGEIEKAEKALCNGGTMPLPNGMQTIRFDALGMKNRMQLMRKKNMIKDYSSHDFFEACEKLDVAERKAYVTDYQIEVEDDTLVTVVISTNIDNKLISPPNFSSSKMPQEEVERLKEEEAQRQKKAEESKKEREEKEKERLRSEAKKDRKKAFVLTIVFAILTIVMRKIANTESDLAVMNLLQVISALGFWPSAILAAINLFRFLFF